jgi:hypothetical protein
MENINQGGIVDRSISGVKDPVLKLVDVDNDNDLDLIYGSQTSGSQLLKYDGKRLVNEQCNTKFATSNQCGSRRHQWRWIF